jgi:hypothetical protein
MIMEQPSGRWSFGRGITGSKKVASLSVATIALAALALWGCHGSGSQLPGPKVKPADNFTVRGYLAVVVGNSGLAEKNGIYARGIPEKNIYLPGIDVYLRDPQTGKSSDSIKTDLSGRFTLFAPAKGSYQLCWKSKVYDVGCTPPFIGVNGQPQFLSTVYMSLPRKPDSVAVMGNIRDAQGESVRTLDPYLNINAFATVALHDAKGNALADVYVNNFGDYLLPYVPVKQTVNVTASIESAKFVQEIRPEAELEASPLNQLNLRIQNSRPHLDPLTGFDSLSGRRVQNALPGSTVRIKANARDKDGDPINFAWFVDSAEGQLAQTTGASVEWKLPAAPGRYSVTVVAYDNKGGYDKATLSVLADGDAIPFSGVVVEPGGAPVAGAAIEIVGNPVPLATTDANGRFQARAKEADRYVFNIRKEGYALNSQVYDGAVVAGRWILRPAQVVTIDPTQDATISHRRTKRDCTGPDSAHAGLGVAGDSLLVPQWQDGKGNVVDAPVSFEEIRSLAQLNKKDNRAARTSKRQLVFPPRGLQVGECGPGIVIDIPAHSILDASGNPATAPLKVGVATVDLLSAQQMPGDDSVVPLAGGGAYIQSYGAGSLDLPAGFKLKPGATAKITIPVDRARLGAGAVPATIPLLSYNEQKGLWEEEDKLTLSNSGGVQAYIGKVKHFTSYNADTFFNNAACLRVFSPGLPGQYNLEVMSPYPDGTPHYKNYPIDNVSSTEHVIYNITPNANMTLAPMTSGPNPQLLGFYVVNSGPPQTPSNSPNVPPGPPYDSCQNFVVMKVLNAPDSPFGGEFLHGLGFIDAANLGFDDLTSAGPTGNALRDAVVTASKNYYTSVDPNNLRTTFADFKSHHGFAADPTTPAVGEFVAQYANSGDLGFGRDMHCLKKVSGDVSCYVTNYGNGYKNTPPGGGTDDHDDANAAGSRDATKEVATVAMEYAPIEGDPAGDRVVKFFVYKKNFPNSGDYSRSISANLDGRGERPVPQLCMICHGGLIPNQSGGIPAFGTAAQVKLGSRFLPFDHRFFTFPADPALSKANQELRFKNLNEQIVNAAPVAGASDPIHEIVAGLYNNGASSAQIRNFTVPGWAAGASANAPNQNAFYQGVVADTCRTCHIAQPYPQLQFNNSDKFINVSTAVTPNNKLMLGTVQQRACGEYVMPHTLRTHDIFWARYWDVPEWGAPLTPYNQQLQSFGDGVGGSTWKPNLCTSFISGSVSTPSQFYQQTIQPIWNGKCVACHVVGGSAAFLPLTEGASYGGLVPSRVVPGNDANNAGKLLQRITGVGPGAKMPQGCIAPPAPPGPGQLPCLAQSDIDKIKAWIRSGAN